MARTFRLIIVIKVNGIDLIFLQLLLLLSLSQLDVVRAENSFSMRFASVEVQKVPPPYKTIRSKVTPIFITLGKNNRRRIMPSV